MFVINPCSDWTRGKAGFVNGEIDCNGHNIRLWSTSFGFNIDLMRTILLRVEHLIRRDWQLDDSDLWYIGPILAMKIPPYWNLRKTTTSFLPDDLRSREIF